MRRIVVLVSLVFSFVLPLAIPVAQASEDGIQAQASSCRNRRGKKQRRAEGKSNKSKKKGKNAKKPYGFEL